MELTHEEFNALDAMYRSEGFGIMVRLLDNKINSNLGVLLGGDVLSESANSAIINNMRGMGIARNLVQNTLKEEGSKYDKRN